ncbi:YbaB/EbfC family nucleoid-associated protein [Actinomadura rupiterrae]|uniref:YbaB/EbfC family nucleoid-associated protein n=1 Tax=Actinomadura rupiterrae TaxID=559627 RepID=UPI0020A3668B|nr:YbaB/EbfC family nucleoid-associated protein [Actinomadura rupiterrae]
MAEQTARLRSTGAELRERTASATSANRLVTATVDARGGLVGLTFNTTRYRTMAPAELAAAVSETVVEAQRTMAEQVSEAFEPLRADKERLRSFLGAF